MLPILKALKERLLNEPAFFLSACAAAATVLADQVELPVWMSAGAVVLAGLATRAVVVPAAKAKAQRLRAARAAKGAAR